MNKIGSFQFNIFNVDQSVNMCTSKDCETNSGLKICVRIMFGCISHITFVLFYFLDAVCMCIS